MATPEKIKERVAYWQAKGYSEQLAKSIVADEGLGTESPAAGAQVPVPAETSKATKSNTHVDECGEVGETGEHGDLGTNGRAVEEEKETAAPKAE